MRKSLFVLFVIFSTTYAIAQLPPTNMYENLKIYESNSLYVNGEKVAFDGKDYLYLDYESDDLYCIFFSQQNMAGKKKVQIIGA